MRISGGKARGISLTTGRADQVRPATDRMREAVFSSLGERIGNAAVLDLFAGTGSYGLEALSRGATSVLFVEKSPHAMTAVQRNLSAVLKSMGNPPDVRTNLVRRDVLRFRSSMRFDVVFMDPPYDLAREKGTQLIETAGNLMAETGVLVYELPADLEIPGSEWECIRRIGKPGKNEPNVAILKRLAQ